MILSDLGRYQLIRIIKLWTIQEFSYHGPFQKKLHSEPFQKKFHGPFLNFYIIHWVSINQKYKIMNPSVIFKLWTIPKKNYTGPLQKCHIMDNS